MPRIELSDRNRAVVLARIVKQRSWSAIANEFNLSVANVRRIVLRWGPKYSESVSHETGIAAMHD